MDVNVIEALVVIEAVPESVPVFDELASAVNEDVGVRDVDDDKLSVELGVPEEVGVPKAVSLDVTDNEPVSVGVLLNEIS